MKPFILILAFLISVGCSKNEEPQKSDILNQWSLIKFEPGFSPTENFDKNAIIWEFQADGTLKIILKNEEGSSPIKPAGTYSFELNEGSITIEGMQYDVSVNNEVMVISDNLPADGFRATFSLIGEK